ncbi:hypothetical protein GIB67_037409 [Kingdonia uniflora]|uniref:Uncharacterized protein n=1 Tax=Kingdonia uniflora TaxID=39325 RepID=A0A7J7M8I5_9MAGN|nr:hypothetical protein GIB67_037409 [Kingdonia uniflora]
MEDYCYGGKRGRWVVFGRVKNSRDEIEKTTMDVNVHTNVLLRDTMGDAFKSVEVYLSETMIEMEPTFLETVEEKTTSTSLFDDQRENLNDVNQNVCNGASSPEAREVQEALETSCPDVGISLKDHLPNVKIGLLRQFLINLQAVSLGTKLAVLFSAIALAIIAQSYNFGRNVVKKNFLHLASMEQRKADEKVLRLVEEQKREKEAAMNKILTLEKELDVKQKLELEITELKGKMKVMNHIEEKDDNGVQHKMKEMQEELEEKGEEIGDMESMNTTAAADE